jgi:hypothetical protein
MVTSIQWHIINLLLTQEWDLQWEAIVQQLADRLQLKASDTQQLMGMHASASG